MSRSKLRKVYQPGETAPESGLYSAYHIDHRPPHHVVVLAGEAFPGCRTCLSGVRFQLEQEAPHVTHDFDLTAPDPRVLLGLKKAS